MLNLLKSTKILLPFVVLVAVLTLAMPRHGEFEYHYRKGGKWNYETLVAPFSFPILKTQEQIEQEKERLGSTYVPYYKYIDEAYGQCADRIQESLGQSYPGLADTALTCLKNYYVRGILPAKQSGYSAEVFEDQDILFLQREKRAAKVPREEIYTADQVRILWTQQAQKLCPSYNVDSIFSAKDVYACIASNMVFDRQTTEMVHEESAEFVSPTSGTFPAGDVIVSQSEIITADIAQLLDSYKAEFESNVGYNGPNWMLWLGNFGLSIILCVLVFSLLFFIRERTFSQYNEFLFIITLFAVACVVTFLFSNLPANWCYMIPYPAFALYYRSFFRKRLVIPLYVLCLLPLLIFIQGGAQFFVLFLLSGFVGVYAHESFQKGWRQFITVFIMFAVTVFGYFTFRMFSGSFDSFQYLDLVFIALGSLFTVFVYPLTYLFEIVFNLMSENRLQELRDTSRPLLKELAAKAPGTFQHSLAVMNMAEIAAKSIDADVSLIRTAALYHDVGKMLNPMCFVENQAPGVKYHDLLGPKESATDIIRHVSDGVALCEKHAVPAVIRRFVVTHHGTTTASYFWTKYLNDGGDPADEPAFTYPGPKPATKEEALLMFCDTLEAASRTLPEFSYETVSAFVEDIYKKKFEAGQFDLADISLRELDTVKETLKNYITQVHHGRIVYPKRNDN